MAGSGARAIIAAGYDSSKKIPGHAFNVANFGGEAYFIDVHGGGILRPGSSFPRTEYQILITALGKP